MTIRISDKVGLAMEGHGRMPWKEAAPIPPQIPPQEEGDRPQSIAAVTHILCITCPMRRVVLSMILDGRLDVFHASPCVTLVDYDLSTRFGSSLVQFLERIDP